MSRPLRRDDINPDNPFGNGMDVLGYSSSAEVLTTILSTITSPYVLAIDAAWGRGKTIFLTQWMYALKKVGFRCIYLNAWENDFVDDPLLAFLAEAKSALSGGGSEVDKTVQANFERLKKAAPKIIRGGIRAGVRMLTYGALDLPDEGLEGAVADGAADLTDDILSAYESQKGAIDEFKEGLHEWVDAARADSEMPESPVIFIVDELDRCRPLFAIELLERIKHLFSVDGMVFVLGLDKEQLSKSIKSVYGDVDALGYLRRFIDLEYVLPDPEVGAFLFHLVDRHGIRELLDDPASRDVEEQVQAMVDTLLVLADVYSLSLRDMEKIISRIALIFRSMRQFRSFDAALVAMLVCVRYRDMDKYNSFRRRAIKYNVIDASLSGHPRWVKFKKKPVGVYLSHFLNLGFMSWDEAEKALSTMSAGNGEFSDNAKLDILKRMSRNTGEPLMQKMIDKIEMTANFVL